jgi:hypothetical protein
MKQTAVEWLVNEIKVARKLCDDSSMEMDIWHTLDVLIAKEEQAKEMEKQQQGYSEEEVLEMLNYFGNEEYIKQWFEQFKNK